jgi:sterol desaturase/sphingolipid hydroxylase (fatty acid hydroxylase superfamily)
MRVAFGVAVHIGGVIAAWTVLAVIGISPTRVLAVTFPLGFLAAGVAGIAAWLWPSVQLATMEKRAALQGFFVEVLLKGFGVGFGVLLLAWGVMAHLSPVAFDDNWAKVAVVLVGADLAYALLHRGLMHAPGAHGLVRRARREHAVHHRVEALDFLRGSRGSWLDNGVVSFPLPVAILSAAVGLDLGGTLLVYMTLMMVQVTHHANHDFDLGPLRWVFLSDHAHKLHHCKGGRLVNFACVFSIWDRLGGTYLELPGRNPGQMHRDGERIPRSPELSWSLK